MAPSAASTRRDRERDLVAATRALFDERGVQDALIEEIARAVGINKALIYRVFSSKEEPVRPHGHPLPGRIARGRAGAARGPARALDRFTRFCLRYPAFLDCALSLMRRPAAELRERVGRGCGWAPRCRRAWRRSRGSSPTRACASRTSRRTASTRRCSGRCTRAHRPRGQRGAPACPAPSPGRGAVRWLVRAMPSRSPARPGSVGSETLPPLPKGPHVPLPQDPGATGRRVRLAHPDDRYRDGPAPRPVRVRPRRPPARAPAAPAGRAAPP